MELDLENPLCSNSHSNYYSSDLFHIESALLPGAWPPDLFFRRKCISLISRYNNSINDPFLTYLAINYLDRFLCLQNTQDWKPWTVSLVAVSCISLALKMTGTLQVLQLVEAEEDGESIIMTFDPKTIQRMEMVILGALKWRMRSITPFSFITFFLSLFNLKHPSSPNLLRARATQIIFKSQNEASLMGCKPSIMAASSLLVASHELFPLHFPCFRESICQSSYVDKDNLMNCYGAMQESENGGGGRRAGSPVHMFDRWVWSTSSSETEEVGGASAAMGLGGGEESGH